MRHRFSFLLLGSTLVACADEPEGPTAEQLAARQSAAAQACVADRLYQRAAEELATLEQLAGESGLVAFQRAYEQHATLRRAYTAQVDTALNHSRSPEDSTAHAAAAERLRISAPDPESVEANVIRSYERNAAALLSDPDHPCNWEAELRDDAEGGGGGR
jgi:hypothetical protein